MRRLRRLLSFLVLLALRVPLSAQAVPRGNTLVLPGLGQATAELDGPWEFHVGDDPRWAAPGFDDSGWERISADKGWGAQGHFAYDGFAWYRRHIEVPAVPGAAPDLSAYVPAVQDAYEVFWNGRLVGEVGRLPPHAKWFNQTGDHTFDLGRQRSGVLALRVWTAPLNSQASGLEGGLSAPPVLGSPDATNLLLSRFEYQNLRRGRLTRLLQIFYGLTVLVSFVLWLRQRGQMLLLWLSLFALTQVIVPFFSRGLEIPFAVHYGCEVALYFLWDVSTWFLLLYLLHLRGDHRLTRWAYQLIVVEAVILGLDFGTALFWAHGWPQLTDGVLSILVYLPELFPLALVWAARRQKLPMSTWLVAILAMCSDLILVSVAFLSEEARFTHWTFGFKIYDSALFTLDGSPVRLVPLVTTLLLLALLFAVYRSSEKESERKTAMAREFHSAQELQRVLIPEELPSVLGYEVTSAYRPAQEVGGDFFQLIPQGGGSALLIVGDVSGKGLAAAMAVALIIGAIRTAAEQLPSPAEMLASINRRLQGRLGGGFATCVVLRLEANGDMIVASAGHPAPFLNGQEIALPPALPLGISLDAEFEEWEGHLLTGDYLTLYSDGLLEARNARGELYGFERLRHLAAGRPTASAAADAAIAFGQDDDITVVTVTRLRVGAASRTSLVAPELVARPTSA